MGLRAVTTQPNHPLDIARSRVLDYHKRKVEKHRLTQAQIDGGEIDQVEREKQFIARAVRFRRTWWAKVLRIR